MGRKENGTKTELVGLNKQGRGKTIIALEEN